VPQQEQKVAQLVQEGAQQVLVVVPQELEEVVPESAQEPQGQAPCFPVVLA